MAGWEGSSVGNAEGNAIEPALDGCPGKGESAAGPSDESGRDGILDLALEAEDGAVDAQCHGVGRGAQSPLLNEVGNLPVDSRHSG